MIDIVDSENERKFLLKDSDFNHPNLLRVEETLNDFIKNDRRDIVIDLMKISRIDSMTLAMLLRIKLKMSDSGRNFIITNPTEGVTRVLQMSSLDSYLLE